MAGTRARISMSVASNDWQAPSPGSMPRSANRQSSAEIAGSMRAAIPCARAAATAQCDGLVKTPGWP